MLKTQTIKCAFCQGTGEHPHFTGTCPVCKGRGKNQVRGEFMTCPDCRGTGQKGGTTLTCFSCDGLGVVPDTREEFKRARKEIQKAREEMAKERPARFALRNKAGGEEFREKSSTKKKRRRRVKIQEEKEIDEDSEERSQGSCYCQACASKADRDSILKVCLKCFKKIKGL